MKRKTNYLGAIILMLVGAGGVYAVGTYVINTPKAQRVPEAIRREETPTARHATEPEVTARVEHEQPTKRATVYVPKSNGENLTFETMSEAVPKGQDAKVFALNRFLENTRFVSARARVVRVEVKDGIALIDVTEGFETSYGSLDERTILQGIGKTLAQFPDVSKMQFFVSGKAVESLGNVDLTQPVDINGAEAETGSTQTGA